MAHSFLRLPLRAGTLVSFSLLAGACETEDLYRESGGRGNYRILSHHVLDDCGSRPQVLADARCIQVFPTAIGLVIQNCNAEQEQLELTVELERRGQDYGLTRIDSTRCVDTCLGGVTTGCTSNCPGGLSCDATALVYSANLDLDTHRLALELATHAQVQIPMENTDTCGAAFARQPALDAPCTRLDEIEAQWEGWND